MDTTTTDIRTAAGSSLLRWLGRPTPDTGVRFAGPDGSWEHWPYPRLAAAIDRAAQGLHGAGVRVGDTVVIIEPTGPAFVVAFFGAMLAGATPAPAMPPALGRDPDAYANALRYLIGVASPRVVVTTRALWDLVNGIATSAGAPRCVRDEDLAAWSPPGPGRLAGRLADQRLAELALLQFTSGSTGRPRGVRVPFDALESNVESMGIWLGMRSEDPTASWLPTYHDMGLIGCLITPIAHQSDLWLMSPEQFVRHPLRYLRCFGEARACFTAMPTFGLEHIVRRVRAHSLAGLDFSAWRAVIIGAERVSDGALDAFARLLQPYGLRRHSLRPAYGLAEATLAVTGLPLAEEWTAAPVDARRVVVGGPVPAGERSGGSALVGSGRPLPGVGVRIISDGGDSLPDECAGEIVITGRSVTAGYLNPDAASGVTTFPEGELHTGDIGFLRDGQLFVLGRLGDSIKLRGRTLFAEDVEAALEQAGLPRHRQTVLLGDADGPMAVLVVENADPAHVARATPLVARLTEGAAVRVVAVPVGTIARTSSGKPRRRLLWKAYLSGGLPEGTGLP